MIDGIPKISVLVICYNQENVISRAIDSLLAQKDYIYEICVSDDCSKDRTWDILQEYSRQYPGLFVLNRNEPNVGIFENIEKTWTMPTGDLVYRLAGDDECGDGWFKSVIDYINANNIEYVEENIAIYGDYQCCYPSGDSFVFSNKSVISGLDPVRMALRGIIGNRSSVCSIGIVRKYVRVSKGKSHVAESAQDRQLQLFAEKSFYIPKVGNKYYARIGVSANMNECLLRDRENIEPYCMEVLLNNGYLFKRPDIAYMQLKHELAKRYRIKSPLHLFKILWLRILSFNISLFFRGLKINRYLFAIRLRLPHRKKINMTV